MKKRWLCAAIAGGVLAWGGGVGLSDVRVWQATTGEQKANARASPLVLAAGEPIDVCFNLQAYTYSGHRYEPALIVFELRKLASVGGDSSVLYFFQAFDPVRDGDVGFGKERNDFELRHCVAVSATIRSGQYELLYNRVLMFPSDFHGHSEDFYRLLQEDIYRQPRWAEEYQAGNGMLQRLAGEHQTRNRALTETIFHFRIAAAVSTQRPPSTYLKLDGSTPLVAAKIEAGVGKPPVAFSWFVRPAVDPVQFRYRLYPSDADWSPWSTSQQVTYYFIPPGSHQFQVETRFRRGAGDWISGDQAQYQFFLESPLVAKPTTKTPTQATSKRSAGVDLASFYSRSRALLIGVTEYQDASFGRLPFVENDVRQVAKSLAGVGFGQITPLVGALSKTQILEAARGFAQSVQPQDRAVLYVSSHGFTDPDNPTKGYLATNDCRPEHASALCIALTDLEQLFKASNGYRGRHVLILLDSCSSGLGVIDKRGSYPELQVAAHTGVHMMAAGLADQTAEQDKDLKMSTFSYYVAEALSGKADLTGDGIISLSELLVYVRYAVATRTSGRQTPMMGRISGTGEMIFPLSEH